MYEKWPATCKGPRSHDGPAVPGSYSKAVATWRVCRTAVEHLDDDGAVRQQRDVRHRGAVRGEQNVRAGQYARLPRCACVVTARGLGAISACDRLGSERRYVKRRLLQRVPVRRDGHSQRLRATAKGNARGRERSR